jgi:molybdate transport system substrate-binding protein
VAAVLGAKPAAASDFQVGVAMNFARPMDRIAADFTRKTGHRAIVVTGATGTLFAQIEHGAPLDVFLAADRATPQALEADGFGVAGTRFTYAVGVLVLWSARPGYVDPNGAVLQRSDFRRVAIADPKLAPYGAAAIEVLSALHLLDATRPKLVQGDSIGQTFTFVATGNADLGFVALSQVVGPGPGSAGSYWIVPPNLHSPIQQDAVLLRRGAPNPAARAFCEYLRSDEARDVIRAYGYATSVDASFSAR